MASLVGVCVGGLVHLLVLLNFSTQFGRQTLGIGFASGFFDIQAKALREGSLSVPEGSLGLEGFVVGDKTYMYFGPFPSLLRVPVQWLTGDDFYGQLTVASMLVAWTVLAVFAIRLVWLVRACLYGDRPLTRTHAVLGGILVALLTGGTSLTYNASQPWAYHEIYAWQTALSLVAAWLMIRIATGPNTRLVIWLGVVLASLTLTRTTGGWGMILGALALGLWFRFGRTTEDRRDFARPVLVAAGLALLAGIIVNWAKFSHPFMFPLEAQVWTGMSQQRRDALAANGGSLTGPQFFLTSLNTYFNPGSIRFVDYFPWITFPAHEAQAVAGAHVDQAYRTGSITAFMPLSLGLSVIALVPLLGPTRGRPDLAGIRALRAPVLGAFLMTGGVMAYGYLAYRYTGDFVPALMLGSLVGGWGVVAKLVDRSPQLTWPVLTLVAMATVFSMIANASVGFATMAVQGRGAELSRYIALQDKLGGGAGSPFSELIHTGDKIPEEPLPTDSLLVVGACQGLYLSTGDANTPWVAVEEAAQVVTASLPKDPQAGTTELFTVSGATVSRVVLETRASGAMRIRVDKEEGSFGGQWFTPAPLEKVYVGVRANTALGYYEISSTPGGFAGTLPATWFDEKSVQHPSTLTSPITEPRVDQPSGVRVAPGRGVDPVLCRRLVEHNAISLTS